MTRPLAEIQADLTLAYASRRKAIEAAEYTMDSGQGRMGAKRDLAAIESTIRALRAEYDEAEDLLNGVDSGIIEMDVRRYG